MLFIVYCLGAPPRDMEGATISLHIKPGHDKTHKSSHLSNYRLDGFGFAADPVTETNGTFCATFTSGLPPFGNNNQAHPAHCFAPGGSFIEVQACKGNVKIEHLIFFRILVLQLLTMLIQTLL